MSIIVYGNREWALRIFAKLSTDDKCLITGRNYDIINKLHPDLVVFLGWSHIIPEDVVAKHKCICLHPSPLPRYRGGSPIQHQIINGEETGAVTLFVMDKGVDTGPIVFQREISLCGELCDIFDRIVDVGAQGLNEYIPVHASVVPIVQNESWATTFKRRKPSQSEITVDEITTNDAVSIHNKVRSLQHPYPLPYILCNGGTKLYILRTSIENEG